MQPDKQCCESELHAWFVREGLYKIGLRHTGVHCAGKIEGLVKGAWFHQGRYLKTGETYR